jgi:hypothetical protein
MKAINRLYQYLEYKGLKPTNFEKEIGLSSGYLSTQKKRKADIGESVLNRITDYCCDLNPTWLLTGVGEMLLDFTKGITGGEKPEIDKEFNEIRDELDTMNKLIQSNKKNEAIHDQCYYFEMKTMMINAYVKHYGTHSQMADSLALFTNGEIKMNELKEDFKKHLSILKELFEIISPYIESFRELELKLSEFDDRHDRVYSIDDDIE